MRLAALLPLALSVALSASSASAAVAASNGLVTTAGSSPLILFLHGIGRQVAETVLLFGIPEQQVVSLQFNRVPARLAWSTTLAAYGLASCETRIPSVVVAGAPERIAPVCRSMGVPLERWGAALTLSRCTPSFRAAPSSRLVRRSCPCSWASTSRRLTLNPHNWQPLPTTRRCPHLFSLTR